MTSYLLQKTNEAIPKFVRVMTENPKATRVVTELKMYSFDKRSESVMKRLAQAAHLSEGLNVSGPVHLPTKIKRWTMLRSPFVKKVAREQFELRIHKKLLVLEGDVDNTRRFLAFAHDAWEPSIATKIKTHKFFPLDRYYTGKTTKPVETASSTSSSTASSSTTSATATETATKST